MEIIEFKKVGYDPQIDYIKGISILFVIMTHSMSRRELSDILFPFWGDTAVPLFLLIQVFHYYKKYRFVKMPSVYKLWRRILMPFLLMIGFMFIVLFIINYNTTNGHFSPKLYWDMRGPGSYYIFIYLEFAFLTPLLTPVFERFSTKCLLIFFIIISQLFEFSTSITHCSDNIYRLLFFRYFFLIYLGHLLASNGIILKKHTIYGVILSAIFIYIFNYTNINLEPFFYTSIINWKNCHWICYIYIAYFILWLLKISYNQFCMINRIRSFVVELGNYSYEIYLFQLFYYATISLFVNYELSSIESYLLRKTIYVTISIIICIMPVALLKKTKKLTKRNLKS